VLWPNARYCSGRWWGTKETTKCLAALTGIWTGCPWTQWEALHLTFIGLCIVIYSYSKINKMHHFLKLCILVKHSTCFGWSFRPSSGAQDSTYSNRQMSNRCRYLLLAGTRWNWESFRPSSGAQDCTYSNRNMSNSCRYLLLAGTRWNWVLKSSNPTTLMTGCSNGHTNARCCRYSDMSSWWWVEMPPETCKAVYGYKWNVYICSFLDYYWQ
jgi:hypothetical protein